MPLNADWLAWPVRKAGRIRMKATHSPSFAVHWNCHVPANMLSQRFLGRWRKMYTATVYLPSLLLGLRGPKVIGRFDSPADAILTRVAGSSDRQSKQQYGHSLHDTHDKTYPDSCMHVCAV